MTKANAGYVAKADRAGGGATEETEVKKEVKKPKTKDEAKEPKAQQEAKQEGGKKRKQEVKEPEAEVEQNEACWC